MSLSLAVRRTRLLVVRDAIDAGGGGTLLLYGSAKPASADTTASSDPLAAIALSVPAFALHETEAQMDLIPAQGFASISGIITWARYVSGAGQAVYDCTAGPPGSGAQIIVTDGAATPTAQVYTGGEVNVAHAITEP